MARLILTNLKEITVDLRKRITEILRDPSVRSGLGEILVDYIRTQSFGSPAPSTAKIRKYLERYNKVDKDYNSGKIKAIFTGELLNDLAGNVKANFKGGKATFEFAQSNKKHKKYQGKKKKIGSTRSAYSAIQSGLESLGYDYIEVDDATIDKMTQFIQDTLLRKLR